MNEKKTNMLEDYGILIYKVISGSHSYGTNIEGSDMDIRGVFIPHRKFLFGNQNVETFKDPNEEDAMYYSLQKFVNLALECNPNIVELLTVDEKHILYMTEEGEQLRKMASLFLTKNAFKTFGSYAFAQFKKLLAKDQNEHQGVRKPLIDEYGLDTKACMHFERITDMGIEILSTGQCFTFRPDREKLLNFRKGIAPDGSKITIEYMKKHAELKQKRLEESMKTSTIPSVPDFDFINRWVINVTDKVLGIQSDNGIFNGKILNVLPLEYEMIDKSTILLVSNPLVRRKNKAQAQGVSIPYKDWFSGLRTFSEFKFGETTIEHIHKFVNQVKTCNPRHIDVLYAGEEHILHKYPLADELKEKLKELPTTKTVYYKAKGFIKGNMQNLYHWESLKKAHNELKEKIIAAKELNESYWEQKSDELSNQQSTLSAEDYKNKRSLLIKEYKEWQSLTKRPKLNLLPDIPKKTTTTSASLMGKYGFDTLLASELVHVAKMFIELLTTGTIQDSRVFEPEMYAIKHGQFKTFEEFEIYINQLQKQLEEAKNNSILKTVIQKDFDLWLQNFIERYLETLV